MYTLSSDSSNPLYVQVVDALIQMFKDEDYDYGDRIPSENELCDLFGVSRITVRKAVSELVEKGVLIKKRGKGTYITYPKVIEEVSAGGSFTKSSELIGTKPTTKIVSVETVLLEKVKSNNIREAFANVKEVIKVERVRLADDVEMIYEIDYFFGHHQFMLEADLANRPLLDSITSKTGLIAHVFEDKFNVKKANEKISELLNCAVNFPLLHVVQKVLTKDESLIYLNEQYIRQDLYKYVVRSEK